MGDVPSFASLPPFPNDIETAPLVTIELKKLLANDANEAARLFTCGKELGFYYLNLMGCEQGERLFYDAQRLLSLEKQFFDLPLEEKALADRDTLKGANGYYGYKGYGKSIMDAKGTRDKHECFNLKKDDIVGNTEPLDSPQLIKDNRDLFRSYALNAQSIIILMLGIFNDQLGLPAGTLQNLHRLKAESGDHVRFLTAPPQPPEERGVNAGAHTDFGSLTVLFNWLGGLQVQLPGTTNWTYVRPVPGCAIVNLGDAMVKFTAGLLRSNIHRVVTPPGRQAEETRYSLVYFSRPEDTVPLQRLKGGLIDEQPHTNTPEEALTSKQWILKRGLANKMVALRL
ncbi:Clavaminate synthase-like protein [Dacryopinax primogenitus]|uniref:Clavaminate synthase-like protein n=1 Tax=Dacryopinax primogenitus (strain DJM 731) TaxID=1858805 RepID=M5FSS4_DACPD|nr:Clavaminate synthase-like protein [Dacryopinax primogenitus]EJT98998.1 Clavaminate synthase-like protein [Dacryopinax primogenitus]